MVGNWGLLAVEAPALGLTPQPEECLKGAIATQTGSPSPGRTLTSEEGTGPRRHFCCGSPQPLVLWQGCLLRLGLGHPGLGCSEMRGPRGCPTGLMGSTTLGRRRRVAEGLEPASLWSWLDPCSLRHPRMGREPLLPGGSRERDGLPPIVKCSVNRGWTKKEIRFRRTKGGIW